MKQKLALACTLIHEPRVILLDEPTTGVDPVSRREFWKLLAEFLEQGITILVSTPYLDEAERCHRVALLHEGRLLSLDTPDRLRRSLPGQMVEAIVDDQPRAVAMLSAHAAVADVHVFGERMHVQAEAVGHRGRRGADARGAGRRRLRRPRARASCRPRSRTSSSPNCLEHPHPSTATVAVTVSPQFVEPRAYAARLLLGSRSAVSARRRPGRRCPRA